MLTDECLAIPQTVREDNGFPILTKRIRIRTIWPMDGLDEKSEF
jgi:hypothetical protein